MSFNSLFGLGSHSPDASLEGWWPLQETTSTQADDYSGNARHGTINGMGSNPVTATGPNSWLTSAYDFDGVDDYIDASLGSVSASAISFGGWYTGPNQSSINAGVAQIYLSGDDIQVRVERLSVGGTFVYWNNTTDLDQPPWQFFGLNSDQSVIDFWRDGTLIDSDTHSHTIGSFQSLDIGRRDAGGFCDCQIAGNFIFSRELLASEWLEAYEGPEPVNTSAPLVTGLAPEGSTLSCSTGTWGLDAPFGGGSNGTITYSYQWTRNGGDISGATSSTYVTQSADVGNDIGCRVRASNDGGFDSAADTDSSNTVTVTSSGGGISIPVAMAHYRRMRVA